MILDLIQSRREELVVIGTPSRDELLTEIISGLDNLSTLTSDQEIVEGIEIGVKLVMFLEAAIEVATREFHSQRLMFYIIGDTLEANGEAISHREWADREGWDYDNAIRGYLDLTGVYAYKGSQWYLERPEDVERFKNSLPVMIEFGWFSADRDVYNGVVPGIPGTRWPGREYLGKVKDIVR